MRKSALAGGVLSPGKTRFSTNLFPFDCVTILILLAAGAAEATVKETKRRHYHDLPRRRYRGS